MLNRDIGRRYGNIAYNPPMETVQNTVFPFTQPQPVKSNILHNNAGVNVENNIELTFEQKKLQVETIFKCAEFYAQMLIEKDITIGHTILHSLEGESELYRLAIKLNHLNEYTNRVINTLFQLPYSDGYDRARSQ